MVRRDRAKQGEVHMTTTTTTTTDTNAFGQIFKKMRGGAQAPPRASLRHIGISWLGGVLAIAAVMDDLQPEILVALPLP